jgi:outer membrane protein assembly factor BamA
VTPLERNRVAIAIQIAREAAKIRQINVIGNETSRTNPQAVSVESSTGFVLYQG